MIEKGKPGVRKAKIKEDNPPHPSRKRGSSLPGYL